MGTTQSIGKWPHMLLYHNIPLQISISPAEPQRILEQPIFNNVNIDSVVLMWEFPGGTVDNYIVQYVLALDGFASDSIRSILVIGTETSVVIGNLLPRSIYEFRVAAVNNRGISAFSRLTTFTTLRKSYTLSCSLQLCHHHQACICCHVITAPGSPVVTSSSGNTVQETTTVILNCTTTLPKAVFLDKGCCTTSRGQ